MVNMHFQRNKEKWTNIYQLLLHVALVPWFQGVHFLLFHNPHAHRLKISWPSGSVSNWLFNKVIIQPAFLGTVARSLQCRFLEA